MKTLNKIHTFFPIIILLSLVCVQCQNTQKTNPNFSQVAFDKLADEVSNGNVPDITAKILKTEKETFIILDCRAENEYEISHIENARRVGSDDFDLFHIADIPKNSKIVTYCTVGKRSEKIGEKLIDAGYTDVHNLHGSMISWMNEGNPVIDGQGRKTNKLHGFKKEMGFEKHSKIGEIVY